MKKRAAGLKILSFLMITILMTSLIANSVSAKENFLNRIKKMLGFTVYGDCQSALSKSPDMVTGKSLVGCLSYCEEYSEFNLNELNHYKDMLNNCTEKHEGKIQDYSSQLNECYLNYPNALKKCDKYLKLINDTEKSIKNCEDKYKKNTDNYENILENCEQAKEFIYETHPYNSEIYEAYLNAKGTDCIKTTKKDKTWNPVADVNKDGRVDKKDFKLIMENIENDTFGQLAYIDARDYCEVTCYEAGGADLCKQNEVCPGKSVQIRGLGGNCCDKICRGCEDSDDSVGRKYIDFGAFTFGNVTDKNLKYKEDVCANKNLKEQYCSIKGDIKTKNIRCPSQECEGGACITGKCSDRIHKCSIGEPLCKTDSTNTFDCNCIPFGYYQKAKDIETELKKPLKERKHQIEEALEGDSGFSPATLALGAIGSIALGALGATIIGGTITSVSFGGIGYEVSAGRILGGQLGNWVGSGVGGKLTGEAITGFSTSDTTNSDTTNPTALPINITAKSKLIRELTWIKYKLDNIKVKVVCDESEGKVYLECTGSALCQEKEEVLYSFSPTA